MYVIVRKICRRDKSGRKMYTILSSVQRRQRKSDVMTYFGLTACSAVYYQVPHCRFLIARTCRARSAQQGMLLLTPL
jgi:hypothetical protein